MDKLLYLFVGILLKQTVDEFKSLMSEYTERLKKEQENLKVIKPAPAFRADSKEAAESLARFNHLARIGPEMRRLTRKIFIVRTLPLIGYVVLTVVLIWWITRMEMAAVHAGK